MSRFSRIMAAKKKEKNSYFLPQNFLEGKVKQIRKNKPKVRSLTWVMVFLVAENENRQLKDSPQADFGR